ncbi:MAG: hypothetical protein LIP77_07740 [Planctomycetes bacterium]|nr:hypothetical protein [Planctomycetota bacterium]
MEQAKVVAHAAYLNGHDSLGLFRSLARDAAILELATMDPEFRDRQTTDPAAALSQYDREISALAERYRYHRPEGEAGRFFFA